MRCKAIPLALVISLIALMGIGWGAKKEAKKPPKLETQIINKLETILKNQKEILEELEDIKGDLLIIKARV